MAEGLFNASIKFTAVRNVPTALMRAPVQLARELGRAMHHIGRSDIEKLKREQLSGGGKLNVSAKGLRNAFKYKAPNPRRMASINELWLSEYTGWKMFRIFQSGGVIVPRKAKMLTVLAAAGRAPGRKRKYTQKNIKAALRSGEMKIIQTGGGPIIIREAAMKLTKKGGYRKNARMEVIAYLVPRVREPKRLDFFKNFEMNKAEHDRLIGLAADVALTKTAAEMT